MLLFVFCHTSSAQSYGLGFYGHEIDQDKRTSLDLSPNEQLCLNDPFELSFDISFLPGKRTYFGYIFRIIEDDKRNFDLVYDKEADIFNFIIGESLSKISFRFPDNKLYTQWNKLRVKFDTSKGEIVFFVGNQTYRQRVQLAKKGCYKFLYGANAYKQFATTDVPPMKIRDIRISEDNELKYHWPLNEKIGLSASELVEQHNAALVNPMWLKAEHYYWKSLNQLTVSGSPSTAFDAAVEVIYIAAADSLYAYDVKNGQLRATAYPSVKAGLFNIGNQSIFNSINNRLYNFYPDNNTISAYDTIRADWDKALNKAEITDFIQINKFISRADNSLYFMGGYGHHLYKNSIRQYHFNTNKWDTVKAKGDFFTPRYLAALGTSAMGDTAYILGGYGNTSGQQILKPKSLYDMMQFTVKDHAFKKLFEIKPQNGDFTFGNSLIIDEKAKSYYGLIYPELKFDSKLQLIKGSLENGKYTLVGNTIPYSFNDIRSYADVFYCPVSKRFLVVTILRTMDDQQATVKIYSLQGEPEPADADVNTPQARSLAWLWISGIIAVTLGGFVYYRKRKSAKLVPENTASADVTPHSEPALSPVIVDINNSLPQIGQSKIGQAQIYLFGELQLVTKEGEEIANSLTRLTKELFLCLFLQSVRWKRGVSAEKLIEILWFDKDEKSARNNRSVNMAKLKLVLDQLGPCTISRNTGYYRIDVDYDQISVDYHNYLKIVLDQGTLTKEKIISLAEITQRGSFLSNCEYEWLDQQKSEIADEIIDTYLRYLNASKIEDDPEMSIKVANYIFHHDHVNEEAMRIKCKALVFLGKHSLAKVTFDNFKKEYKSIYLEDFKEDYHSILE